MKNKLALSIFILMFAALSFPSPGLADGIIIPEPPVCDPWSCPPLPRPIAQLEIRYHRVDVTIEDQIATTRVDQVFYNPNDWAVEGRYLFPIPAGASVTRFKLWIDGEAVEGKILTAEEAREMYKRIVRELQDPALLEYSGQDAVQAWIFPIPPGGERRIELEYSQVLSADQGLIRYLYPLNTEKFSSSPLEEVVIQVDIRSSIPIRATYSPSHPVSISQDGRFHVTVGYEDRNVKPEKDFALYYSIGESEALHLMSFRDPGDTNDPDGYFLLLLAPRPDTKPQTLPKDVILVLDRSGSMEGEKFAQAQSALAYILRHLNSEDRFNVLAFSTGVEGYARGMRGTAEVPEAIRWVESLSALGSTDINRALLEVAAVADPEKPTYIIFLTDGLPTVGVMESEAIVNNFAAIASPQWRLFTFGVGYDVDTYLLDSLAKGWHGTSSYVTPGENLDERLSEFYARINTPVLMDLELDFGGLAVYDLYPEPLPDLFVGSQIVVAGRYRQSGEVTVTLSGMVNGERQTFRFLNQRFVADSRAQVAERPGFQFIPRLWATRKIGHLLQQIRLQGPEQELVDQIVRLSIRHGVVTPYTSYLVTESMPLGAAQQEQIAQEQYRELQMSAGEPAYGREAVEKASVQNEMATADSLIAVPQDAQKLLRVVASRVFIRSGEVWVDTLYDPSLMPTIKVPFLSDDYFALAYSRPELREAFALGSRVIAISDGIAYEVVSSDSEEPAVEIPPPLPGDELAAPTSEADTNAGETAAPPSSGAGSLAPGLWPCLGGLLPLLLTPVGVVVYRSPR